MGFRSHGVTRLSQLTDVNLVSLVDGDVLTWHSSNSKWTDDAPPSVAATYKYKSGFYYRIPSFNATTSDASIVQGKLWALPFVVDVARTFDRVAINRPADAGASITRFGIYSDTGSGYPGALLVDLGTEVTTTAGVIYEHVINQALTPGLYWLAVRCNAAATVRMGGGLSLPFPSGGSSVTSILSSALFTGWSDDMGGVAANTLPDPFPANATPGTGINTAVPMLAVRPT